LTSQEGATRSPGVSKQPEKKKERGIDKTKSFVSDHLIDLSPLNKIKLISISGK
jgi:hypothetical protein